MTPPNRGKTDPTRPAALLAGALLAVLTLLAISRSGAAGSGPDLTPTPQRACSVPAGRPALPRSTATSASGRALARSC
ncbi:MAG: hypothetical protein R2844_05405 [Caldilineales bacterium]